MSVKSWKKEFYGPIKPATSSWLKACEHSLRKWEGATKKNLKKHDLQKSDEGIEEKWEDDEDYWNTDSLDFNNDTCALCQRADKLLAKTSDRYVHRCTVCPLVAIQGGVDCTDIESPFDIYYETGNPTKMIASLRKLHKQLLKDEK